MSDSAYVVVNRPLSVIESQLWTVTNWASCLQDVVSVRRASHERYTMELMAGRGIDEVLVAVRWNARHHRFAWKALDGPSWTGQLQLHPVNGRRTRVTLEVLTVPRTFLGSVADLVGARRRDVTQDLQGIQDLIMSLPEPVRPGRLQVGARVPEPDLGALTIAEQADFDSEVDNLSLEGSFG